MREKPTECEGINMKTEQTLIIEKVLLRGCFGENPSLAKEYGTSEVTIGFQRNGNGKEIVDFLSYDAKKNTYRCYEIKVSMQDFRSAAKKSWCGNYNYLVVSSELFAEQSKEKWKNELPEGVGLIAVNTTTEEKTTILSPKRQNITAETEDVLKTSLLRTLFYQSVKRAERKQQTQISY